MRLNRSWKRAAEGIKEKLAREREEKEETKKTEKKTQSEGYNRTQEDRKRGKGSQKERKYAERGDDGKKVSEKSYKKSHIGEGYNRRKEDNKKGKGPHGDKKLDEQALTALSKSTLLAYVGRTTMQTEDVQVEDQLEPTEENEAELLAEAQARTLTSIRRGMLTRLLVKNGAKRLPPKTKKA